jgi:galactokinase
VDLGETVEATRLEPLTPGWASYVLGIVWALREAGHSVGGAELTLQSDVPVGAGLSSSAAIECATEAALADLYGLEIAPLERAKIAQRAENAYVGAPTGLLDQAAATLCVPDHALFMDCRSLETQQVPLAVDQAGLEILVIDTQSKHSHVDGEYAARRHSCEEACRILGVESLRDVADLDDALGRLPELEGRRVRHIVTENQRVLDSVAALHAGNFTKLGQLMTASHISMRNDYEITAPTVDLAVATALGAGALGARMTGGGFGGCVLALIDKGLHDVVSGQVAAAFATQGWAPPTWFAARPGPGARRIA